MNTRGILLGLLILFPCAPVFAGDTRNSAYVENGVLRRSSGEEVALFGVNYNAPFAFTYRAIDRLGGDHEAAIAMDINHLKRLGVDAYRVHLWDREISDKKGNLLKNEHLRLFDFLVAELKKNDIKIIVTAIGWWGTGYPEPDPEEPGFSAEYTKPEMNQDPEAIAAQKRYIRQLLNHKNRYTNTTYKSDPDIIAIELFNEPKHHGSPAESAAYIEQLVEAARATGLAKPVFYNISEQGNQQEFAKAVCDTSIEGIGYQWYPTGIVRFAAIRGNMLPTVQRYTDVFAGTGSCGQKAKMVYEFDAADITGSVMYPAMARSFREAGFQWATLFSYDPGVTAHSNAEYNTHYLNLLYTPGKAISFLIAGEVFRTMPRGHETAPYPQNNRFLDVTLDYHQDLSLLSNQHRFYYSNNTDAQPEDVHLLRHIAGVGSSPVVEYEGSGAYFLDKLQGGVWQLEVYPDLQKLEDPHRNSSLRREVGRLYSNERLIKVRLPDLGKNFRIQHVNDSGRRSTAENGSFGVSPGFYVLSRKPVSIAELYGGELPRHVLPGPQSDAVSVRHRPRRSANTNDDLTISAQVGSQGKPDGVELLVRYEGTYRFTALPMQPGSGGWYHADLASAEKLDRPGPLEYAIVVKHGETLTTFPGAAPGSPRDRGFFQTHGYWTMVVRPAGTPVALFDAEKDRQNLLLPQTGRPERTYVTGKDGLGLALRAEVTDLRQQGLTPLALLTLAEDVSLTHRDLRRYNTVSLQMRSLGRRETVTFGILDEHGLAYTTALEIGEKWERLSFPLKHLTRGTTLLPHTYPTFMPGTLEANEPAPWPGDAELSRIQGLQFSLSNPAYPPEELAGRHGVEIVDVKLEQAR